MEEALEKVLCTLRIFNSFRSAFREFKSKLNSYFDNVNYTLIDDPKYLEGRDDELRDVGIRKKKKQRKTKPKTWEWL